jgi:hypothetical protein
MGKLRSSKFRRKRGKVLSIEIDYITMRPLEVEEIKRFSADI